MTREKEIKKDCSRLGNYVHVTPYLVRELNKNKNDVDAQRKLLASNGARFLKNVIDTYDCIVTEIADDIINSHAHTVTKKSIKQAVKEVSAIKKTTLIKIKQKQKSGRIYERAKPKRFTKRELIFLHNNQDMKNKELVATYNNYFSKRSASSILTKKYRLRK